MATSEDQRAHELRTWPETRGGAGDLSGTALVGWGGRWDTGEDHLRNASYHRSAAAQLDADYQEACGTRPLADVQVSPLVRYGVGGETTPAGTVILLAPAAGPPARLLEELRCHRAWMMLERTDMEQCPLDLPGLRVTAHGDDTGIELTLTVEDPKLVPVLRERAAHDLEAASHGHH